MWLLLLGEKCPCLSCFDGGDGEPSSPRASIVWFGGTNTLSKRSLRLCGKSSLKEMLGGVVIVGHDAIVEDNILAGIVTKSPWMGVS